MTNWNYVGHGVEGDNLEISGVRVWEHEWACRAGERAEVKAPVYGQSYSFHVYEIAVAGRQIVFAAGEFSASVYGFYTPLTLKKAVAWSLLQQVLVLVWASYNDLNLFTSTQIALYAMAAYWVWFFVFAWRRRAAPTRAPVSMVTWGFLGAWVLSFIVSQLIWRIRRW